MMKRPTLKDIAAALGCSKNTGSLALRGSPQIPPATQERVRKAAQRLGYRPNALLSWRASRPEIAGMNQHNFVSGEAAVDLVVGQIHRNENGGQEFPRATLIGATWVDGASVQNRVGVRRKGAARPISS